MQFAINYSPQAAALLQREEIVIDRFKCPNWDWLIAEARQFLQVYVHFDLIAGNGSVRQCDWAAVERQLAQTGTHYVNLHPDVRLRDFGFSAQPERRSEIERVAEQVLADLAWVSARVGAERVLLENLPFRENARNPAASMVRALSDPAELSRIISAARVGLLLDLSHAALSAPAFGLSEDAYIDALPLARVGEVHVTGIGLVEGERRDHLPMTAPDWTRFAGFIQRLRAGAMGRPAIVAFEYGGVGEKFAWRSDSEVIRRDGQKLYYGVHSAL